jgi:hypothetical protein
MQIYKVTQKFPVMKTSIEATVVQKDLESRKDDWRQPHINFLDSDKSEGGAIVSAHEDSAHHPAAGS